MRIRDLVGADIVEYNPYRDIQNVTAMVAAKLMNERFSMRFLAVLSLFLISNDSGAPMSSPWGNWPPVVWSWQ